MYTYNTRAARAALDARAPNCSVRIHIRLGAGQRLAHDEHSTRLLRCWRRDPDAHLRMMP